MSNDSQQERFACNKSVYIYKYTAPNGKIYIGSTFYINQRQTQHKRDSKTKKFSFYIAIRKYGYENFLFEVIEECCPLLRNERENHWIKYYNTLDHNYGYNLKTADHKEISQDTRIKQSIAHKGKQQSAEHRRKRLESRKKNLIELDKAGKNPYKGENNPFYGKKHTKKTIEKISKAGIGKTAWNTGIKPTEKQKEKQIQTLKITLDRKEKERIEKGIEKPKHISFGKKMSEESNKKKSEAQILRWANLREKGLIKKKTKEQIERAVSTRKANRLAKLKAKLKYPDLFAPINEDEGKQ